MEPNEVDQLNLGIVYSATGKLEQAISEFSALLARDRSGVFPKIVVEES